MRAVTYDVVICGFGGAGAAAAIEAHDHGASVLILEKMATGGGSTAESGGSIVTLTDVKGAIEHYHDLTEGRTPREVLAAHVHGAMELPTWIESCGGVAAAYGLRMVPFPARYSGTAYHGRPNSDAIGERIRLAEPGNLHGGSALWSMLKRNVESRSIDVLFDAPVRSLIQDSDGEVQGVEAETAVGTLRAIAKRGVILTCGGFSYNRDMQREHLGWDLDACGPPGRNTGDGIEIALRAGADLWHMNGIAGAFSYKLPNSEAAWLSVMQSYGFFIVDQRGNRYMDEGVAEMHAAGFVMLVRNYETGYFDRFPSYLIFDEETRLAGPIASNEGGANRLLPWSVDNSAEVARGWILQANSLDELGRVLGLDKSAALRIDQTGIDYNRGVSIARDAFGRDSAKMRQLHPPFYGIRLLPSLLNTQGGPRRDSEGRIIGVDGSPIRRLFGAGELGSIWASLYPGAGNITEALVWGRIAGQHATSMEPMNDALVASRLQEKQ